MEILARIENDGSVEVVCRDRFDRRKDDESLDAEGVAREIEQRWLYLSSNNSRFLPRIVNISRSKTAVKGKFDSQGLAKDEAHALRRWIDRTYGVSSALKFEPVSSI